MNRRASSAAAVGLALLVLLAGLTVVSPEDTAAVSAVDLPSVVDDRQLAANDGVPSPSTPDTQYELYEALSTYVSTTPGQAVRSRADRADEEDHGSDQRIHRWRCPICDATKLSLGASAGDPGEAAANNLRSHLRNSGGHGHGPPGTLPAEITPEVIEDHVVVATVAD